MAFWKMHFNGYWNWLKCIGVVVSMGKWAFPMNASGEEERQPVYLGCVVPSELQFQLYHVHTRLFNPGGFALSFINLCFFLNVDTAKSTAVVPKFMSLLNCPSPPSPMLSMTGGSCLSSESIIIFSHCPALLLCFQTARNPDAAPRSNQEHV